LRRFTLAACLAAVVLVIVDTAPAGAVTILRGRILGRPQVTGVHARVPVLLRDGRDVVLTVPARSGFRTVSTGRTSAGRTRLGDVVRARVRAVRGDRASARHLTIVARSGAPAFGELAARLTAAAAGTKDAAAQIDAIAKAEQAAPHDPAQLRTALLALRYQLNELIRGLRSQAEGMDAVSADVRDLPRAEDLVGELGATAKSARSSAGRLEDGVTGLDEFINSIGGSSSDPLPVGTIGTVGQVLTAALQVLDELDPDNGLPGGPTLPDPLGGVPVPPVAPVRPA
jgi:hypothetical protein